MQRRRAIPLGAVVLLVVGLWAFVTGTSASRASVAQADGGLVQVTPLGSHQGEFCRNDRALLFEDPTGVRILYDPGRTVAGPSDPRLGTVHVLLVSSAHADHIGEVRGNPGAGTCASPGTGLAAGTNAAVIVGGEMHDFLRRKIQNVTAVPTAGCPAAGLSNQLTVPRTSPCVGVLRHGGKRTVVFSGASQGVRIAVVRADHSNGVPRELLTDPEKTELAADELTAYVGPENGFVLTFTNGLVVYLSGDTGHTSDMETIVQGFYGAELAVVNMGDIFSMGPEEAAFAVDDLIEPEAVIPSHANEAATTGGEVNAGTRTALFIDLVEDASVHVPLSGVTMAFDDDGECVLGCG